MVFDRLIARLLIVAPDRWLLKGAVALDFRLRERARATVNLNLYRAEDEAAAMADLVAAQSLDIGDFFRFQVERTDKLDALVDGIAVRYRVRADLDSRRFEWVTLDVGFDQYIASAPDLLTGPDALSAPPPDWRRPYQVLATETGLVPDIESGHAVAARLLDPLLSQTITGSARWDPERGAWG